jgi:hypothetical protein
MLVFRSTVPHPLIEETTALEERVATETAEAQAHLKADREAFVTEYQSKTQALEKQAGELDQGAADLAARQVETAKSADSAQALKSAADEALARVDAREREATQKVRTLREALA